MNKLKRYTIVVAGGIFVACISIIWFMSVMSKIVNSLERIEGNAVAVEQYGNWRSYPVKLGGTPEQNEKIKYAWEISGYDLDFIYTLNGENAKWTHDRVHDNSANTVGTDLGFGVNSYFHPEIIGDKRFFSDWKWQLDRVYQLYSGGVAFYGYSQKGITIV